MHSRLEFSREIIRLPLPRFALHGVREDHERSSAHRSEADQANDAVHYLSLILEKDVLASLKQELARKDLKFASFKVSDLIRASQIEVTAGYVREVSEQLQKIMEGKALKPIILVSYGGN